MIKYKSFVLRPIEVSVKNHSLVTEWLDKVKKEMSSTKYELRKVSKLLAEFPFFAEYMTETGGFNESLLNRYISEIKSQAKKDKVKLSDEDIKKNAEEMIQKQINSQILANEGAVKILHFFSESYPRNFSAMALGKEIIKATARRLNDELTECLESDFESDFWADMDAETVGQYVDSFRNEWE